MTGEIVSFTIMSKLALISSPGLVIMYLTVVVPTEKKSPGLCEGVKLRKEQLLVVVGNVQSTIVPQDPASEYSVKLSGMLTIVGS